MNFFPSISYRWPDFSEVQPLFSDFQWGQSEPVCAAGQSMAVLQTSAWRRGERCASEGDSEGALPGAWWSGQMGWEAPGAEAQWLAYIPTVRGSQGGISERWPTTGLGCALRGLRGSQSAACAGGHEWSLSPAFPGGAGTPGRGETSYPQAWPGVWWKSRWSVLQAAVLHWLSAHRLEWLDHRTCWLLWQLLRRQLPCIYGRRAGLGLLVPHSCGQSVPHARHKPRLSELLLHPYQAQHHVHALLWRWVQHCQTGRS